MARVCYVIDRVRLPVCPRCNKHPRWYGGTLKCKGGHFEITKAINFKDLTDDEI